MQPHEFARQIVWAYHENINWERLEITARSRYTNRPLLGRSRIRWARGLDCDSLGIADISRGNKRTTRRHRHERKTVGDARCWLTARRTQRSVLELIGWLQQKVSFGILKIIWLLRVKTFQQVFKVFGHCQYHQQHQAWKRPYHYQSKDHDLIIIFIHK